MKTRVLKQQEDHKTTHFLPWGTHSAWWSTLKPIHLAIGAQDQVSISGYNGDNGRLLLVRLFNLDDGSPLLHYCLCRCPRGCGCFRIWRDLWDRKSHWGFLRGISFVQVNDVTGWFSREQRRRLPAGVRLLVRGNVLLQLFRGRFRLFLLASLKSISGRFPLRVDFSAILEARIQQVGVLFHHEDLPTTSWTFPTGSWRHRSVPSRTPWAQECILMRNKTMKKGLIREQSYTVRYLNRFLADHVLTDEWTTNNPRDPFSLQSDFQRTHRHSEDKNITITISSLHPRYVKSHVKFFFKSSETLFRLKLVSYNPQKRTLLQTCRHLAVLRLPSSRLVSHLIKTVTHDASSFSTFRSF